MRGKGECGHPVARHHVVEAVGQSRLLAQFGHQQRCFNPGRVRLHDHGIARGQRRTDLLHQQVGRRIERRDRADHTTGNALCEPEVPGAERDCIDGHKFAAPGGEFGRASAEEVCHPPGLERGRAPRLANGAHDAVDDGAGVGGHRLRYRLEPRESRGRGRIAVRLEGLGGTLHRGINEVRACIRHPVGDAPVHRAYQFDTRHRGRDGDRLPADPGTQFDGHTDFPRSRSTCMRTRNISSGCTPVATMPGASKSTSSFLCLPSRRYLSA